MTEYEQQLANDICTEYCIEDTNIREYCINRQKEQGTCLYNKHLREYIMSQIKQFADEVQQEIENGNLQVYIDNLLEKRGIE